MFSELIFVYKTALPHYSLSGEPRSPIKRRVASRSSGETCGQAWMRRSSSGCSFMIPDKWDCKSFVCSDGRRFAFPLFAGLDPADAFFVFPSESASSPPEVALKPDSAAFVPPAMCPLLSAVYRRFPTSIATSRISLVFFVSLPLLLGQ